MKFKVTKSGNLDFKKKLKKWEREIPKMLNEIGEMSVEHFEAGFKKGGKQTDDSKGGWKNLKKGGRSYLTQSGKLSRSLQHRRVGKRSVVVFTNVSYGGYHNTGRGRLPKREFIGRSRTLDRRINKYILKRLNKVFK